MSGRFDTEHQAMRSAAAGEAVAAAFRHERVDRPPVVIGDATYWISGEDQAAVPEDIFGIGGYESARLYQERKIAAHLEAIPDQYVPFLLPWYGTGVVPSAMGCRILFQRGEEPAVEGPVVTDPAQVRRLEPPDPGRDGLMPRVLACIDHFREHSTLPVSFTDAQGPLNIALNLVGLERLIYWMVDDPMTVHELMDLCTTVLIDWIALQKRRAGAPADGGAFPHFVSLPQGVGGVWISDDDCTVLSPELYREFVVPANSRVLKAFGGGTIHYCGNAGHQLDNFLATDGLVGVNAWCMGEFGQLARAQALWGDRLAIIVGDYTPVDWEAYVRDLLETVRWEGLVLTTCPSATNALRYGTGRVQTVTRDPGATGLEAWSTIQRVLGEGRRG